MPPKPTDDKTDPADSAKTADTSAPGKKRMPAKVDLSQWAGPVQFQGGFNTCNAHVVAGLVTYFEKKAHGNDIAPSRLFLYKVAKNFLQQNDDSSGVYIR